MTPFQMQLRAVVRGTFKLTVFAAALFIIVTAFQVPLLGAVLALVLWTIVVRGSCGASEHQASARVHSVRGVVLR